MYCQRHRPTPPPGYGGIAFGQNPTVNPANPDNPANPVNTEKTENTEKEEQTRQILLPVPVQPPEDEERPPETPRTERTKTEDGREPLLSALLHEQWTLEDFVTVIALLLIVSGQADDGILLVVGFLLLIGGEGSL